MKVRIQTQNFFGVEIRNDKGKRPDKALCALPATLGSAYNSYCQADPETLQDWCGYASWAPGARTLYKEVGLEIRKLIRKYGKRCELETLLDIDI